MSKRLLNALAVASAVAAAGLAFQQTVRSKGSEIQ